LQNTSPWSPMKSSSSRDSIEETMTIPSSG
jgi:hypothetical protein